MIGKKENRLIAEKSPYLLQHARNPVDWYPWGEEAWEKARREDKPIFLSIGYSTCHWCHVMGRESFEDEQVAALLNEHFVSIKVDREERPDIDATYMEVCQMMTGSGGWPLTIIMRWDRRPFFAATYIPRQSMFGMIGLLELLPQIVDAWKRKRSEVDWVADKATKSLFELSSIKTEAGPLGPEVLNEAMVQARSSYDEQYGGFGGAPKFPTSHRLLLLLRLWRRSSRIDALEMVERTLREMRMGGIYDHAGFGFHRYSTDKRWLLPHFEKMLYDQAMMCMAYAEAYQATGKGEYASTVREIVEFVRREMVSQEGGFFTGEDADSEGGEGRYYLWTLDEVRDALAREEMEMMQATFDLHEEGNFTPEGSSIRAGTNILHLPKSLEETAEGLGIDPEELKSSVRSALKRLLEARERRRMPLVDDKILADWNGLMVAALAKAGAVLREDSFIRMAEDALRFVTERMIVDGRIRHSYRGGQLSRESFQTDYAFLLWGALELYQATLEPAHLQQARELVQGMIDLFWDENHGAFSLSPGHQEEMIFDRISLYDGAIPSGNSVAFLCMIALSRLTGDTTLEIRADSISRTFAQHVKEAPFAHSVFLMGLDLALNGTTEVVVAGRRRSEDTLEMLGALRSGYRPDLLLILKEPGDCLEQLAEMARGMEMMNGKATAYVCSSKECFPPTYSAEEMIRIIDGHRSTR